MAKKTPTLKKDAVESAKVTPELKTENLLEETGSSRESIVDNIVASRNETFEREMALDDLALDDEPKTEKDLEVKVKINGEDRTVSASDIEKYQKGTAADEKFREVAEEKKDLAKREKDFADREVAFKAQREQVELDAATKVAAAPVKAVVPDVDLDDVSDTLITAVFAEDREGVKGVLEKTMLRSPAEVVPVAPVQIPAKPVTPADIEAVIDQRDLRRDLNAAVEKFDTEYPDLSKNFSDDVDAQTVIEQKKDPEAPFWDILERSAEHVKKKMASVLGVKTVEKETETDGVKKPVTQVRSTVTRRFVPPKPKEEGKTPFEEIQAHRGQG